MKVKIEIIPVKNEQSTLINYSPTNHGLFRLHAGTKTIQAKGRVSGIAILI
ncbi:MAG: hypothetical protein JSV51_06730 [Candidatus Bathyarchaeota archaeon]|nr:MAG: hypothetical protein JSV51_06730 [Candidatus Bathyarchaeota archaeon]